MIGIGSMWKRLFSGPSTEIHPPISVNWAYGDLAECIADGERTPGIVGPDKGDVCKVIDVIPGQCAETRELGWGLKLVGFPHYYAADEFRKVLPLNSAADADFVSLIRSIRRSAKIPEPAG